MSPSAASDAETIALSAARPGCSGFAMVPKFSRNPADSLPAMPSAAVVVPGESRRRLHTPAVAPNTPQVLVMW